MSTQPIRCCLLMLLLLYASLPALSQTAQEFLQLSDAAYYRGRLDSTLYYGGKAAELIERDSGRVSHAYARLADQTMGWTYDKVGNYPQAFKWMRMSVDLYRQLGETQSYEYGEALSNTGEFYNKLGLYNEAEKLSRAAQQVLKPFADSTPGYGAATNALANALNYQGRYAEAELLYSELLEKIRAIAGDSNERAATLHNNLGGIYGKTGRYEKGLQYMHKAAAFFRDAGKLYSQPYAINLLSITAIFSDTNRLDSAEKYTKQTLAFLKDNQNPYLLSNALSTAATIQLQKKNFTQAINYCRQALSVAKSADGLLVAARNAAAIALAITYHVAGKTLQADSTYKAAFKQLYAIGNPDYRALSRLYQGYCAFLLTQKKFAEAADSLQSFGRQTLAFIRQNFVGMAEEEKLSFINTLYRNFDLQYALLALYKNASPSFVQHAFSNALLLKGLVLYNQSAVIRAVNQSRDTAVKKSFADWLLLKQLLAKQYSLSPARQSLNVDSLQEEATAAEKIFSRYEAATENLFPYSETPLKTIAKLKPAEAAVEFVRFNYAAAHNKDSIGYGAFVFNARDTAAHFITLGSEAQLLRLLGGGAAGVQTKSSLTKIYPAITPKRTVASAESRQLYQWLWKPLRPFFAHDAVVYYSPAGLLNYIAFNAITKNGTGVLLDDYRLHALFSVRNLPSLAAAHPLKLSLWGNIDYNEGDSSFPSPSVPASPALPKATNRAAVKNAPFGAWPPIEPREVDALKTLFGKTALSPLVEGKAASETFFKERMNGFEGSVHLSTHGFYTPDAAADAAGSAVNVFTGSVNPMMRCGLVFSGANKAWLARNNPLLKDDGILTGYEISQLDLSKVDLMTLSACETALGKVVNYEGVFGLQRAFKMAGVNGLIMSLWEVPVKETAELMTLFYTAWRGGASPQEALRAAQKELRRKNAPYYWAGFMLME